MNMKVSLLGTLIFISFLTALSFIGKIPSNSLDDHNNAVKIKHALADDFTTDIITVRENDFSQNGRNIVELVLQNYLYLKV